MRDNIIAPILERVGDLTAPVVGQIKDAIRRKLAEAQDIARQLGEGVDNVIDDVTARPQVATEGAGNVPSRMETDPPVRGNEPSRMESNQTGGQSLPERLQREDGSPIPYGFRNVAQYETFVETLKSNLPEGVQAIFQGSSVTGRSSKTREVFDFDRVSDFDIALTGGDLFEEAVNFGYKAKDGTRIGPLTTRQLEKLGLYEAITELRQQAGRKVDFMLFKSMSDAYRRPSILVY